MKTKSKNGRNSTAHRPKPAEKATLPVKEGYDWAVLGNHPAALLSAALVAKLGLSVLILPDAMTSEQQRSDAKSEELDYEFCFLPTLSEGLLRDCLRALGCTDSELAELVLQSEPAASGSEWGEASSGGQPQILTPQHRMRIFADPKALQREWLREFGANHAQINGLIEVHQVVKTEIIEFWRHYPDRYTYIAPLAQSGGHQNLFKFKPKHVGQNRTLEQACRRIDREASRGASPMSRLARLWLNPKEDLQNLRKRDPALAVIFEGILAALAPGFLETSDGAFRHTGNKSDQSAKKECSLPRLLNALILIESGAAVKGGVSAYRTFLLKLAEKNGAKVLSGVRCTQIQAQSGRFKAVQLSDRELPILARGCVAGSSLSAIRSRLLHANKRFWDRSKKPLLPSGWVFSFEMSVMRETLPSGVTQRMIWQQDLAPHLDIEVIPDEICNGQSSEVRIRLQTLVPFISETLGAKFQRTHAARMRQKVKDLFPFLVVAKEIDFTSESPLFPWKTLSEIPETRRRYSGAGVGSQIGVEGLFITGAESRPEFGELGALLSAIEASAWIAHRSGLPGPL